MIDDKDWLPNYSITDYYNNKLKDIKKKFHIN